MANATPITETKVILTGVTVELTITEAEVLAAVVARTAGYQLLSLYEQLSSVVAADKYTIDPSLILINRK